MLKSYHAEISGSELLWLDGPPAPLSHQRVLVIVDDARPARDAVAGTQKPYDFSDLVGRLQWRGDAVAQQRAARDAW